MTRRDFFSGLPLVARPERKNRRVHHSGERLYHGPLTIPVEVLTMAGTSAVAYRTTHHHPVLRCEHGGVVYLFRSAPGPTGAMLGEVVRTPEGSLRVHVWRVIETAPPLEDILRRKRLITPAPPVPPLPMPPMSAPQPSWKVGLE